MGSREEKEEMKAVIYPNVRHEKSRLYLYVGMYVSDTVKHTGKNISFSGVLS